MDTYAHQSVHFTTTLHHRIAGACKGFVRDTEVTFLVTIRDIRAGEELTATYSLYDIPETQGTL